MKRFMPLVVLLLGLVAAGRAGAQQPRATMTPDYVFVVDISRSMIGEGPGNPVNIFPRVKQALERFVGTVDLGSNVVLVPFADGVKGFHRIPIQTEGDRERALRLIRSLEATGDNTHVYAAIQQAFDRYAAFRGNEADGKNRMVWLLVYTDGQDNSPQGLTMAQIIGAFKLRRQEYDYLYYATLGRPLSEEDIRAIEESGVASYVDNQRGEVAPLWIVYPRYPVVDFGNLLERPRDTRVLSFGRTGTGEFPPGFRLEISTQFGGLGDATQVEVEPYSVPAARELAVRLRLVNGTPPSGQYEGTLHLKPNRRQGIVVFPTEIQARFDYGRLPAITLTSRRVTMSESAPQSRDSAAQVARGSLAFSLNPEAQARGGALVVTLEPDRGNPEELPSGAVFLNRRRAISDTVTDVRRRRTIELTVNGRGLEPGRYRGTLVLRGVNVRINGPTTIPWEFAVAEPPIPWWVWALVAAAMAAAVAESIRRQRPVLRGRLIVQEPIDRLNHQVTLNGRREVWLNANADLTREGAQVRIVADGVGRGARPKVFKILDGVYVRKAPDGQDLAFQKAVLEHGDELVWEGHRLTYSKN